MSNAPTPADRWAAQGGSRWYRCSARSLFIPGLADEDVLAPDAGAAARSYIEAAHEELVPDQETVVLDVTTEGPMDDRMQPLMGCQRRQIRVRSQREVRWWACELPRRKLEGSTR